ncbi:hypothetical protein ES703_62461 [subsurface metagenome]
MWYKPSGIGGITVKAKSNMVIDATASHRLKGFFDHLQGPLRIGALPVSEQEKEVVWGGKLRGATETTMLLIKALGKLLIGKI